MSDLHTRSKDLGYLFVVGGPGGSGASTIAKKLADYYSLNYFYGGRLMRDLAKKHGFSGLIDFLKSDVFKEKHMEFDLLIDDQLFEKSFSRDILIDSKIFAALASKNEIPCTVKIWIDASIDVRAERTMGKKTSNLTFEEIRKNLQERYLHDQKRFLDLYNIEFGNQRKYNDIVVNSSYQNPEETFEFILKLIENGRYIKNG